MATPDIVGAAEAAEILGIGNTNFSHLRKHREGTDDAFPDPLVTLKCGPIWLRKDVEKYAKTFTPGRRGSAAGAPVKKVAPAPKAVAKKAPAKKVAATKAPAKRKLALVR
jgi:hypothetical protein